MLHAHARDTVPYRPARERVRRVVGPDDEPAPAAPVRQRGRKAPRRTEGPRRGARQRRRAPPRAPRRVRVASSGSPTRQRGVLVDAERDISDGHALARSAVNSALRESITPTPSLGADATFRSRGDGPSRELEPGRRSPWRWDEATVSAYHPGPARYCEPCTGRINRVRLCSAQAPARRCSAASPRTPHATVEEHAHGHRNRQVVQRREGFWLHHP